MKTALTPVTLEDVVAARERIRSRLPLPTPMRRYAALEARVGRGIASG